MDFLDRLDPQYLRDAGYAVDVATSADGTLVAVATETARGAIHVYIVDPETPQRVTALAFEPQIVEGQQFRWPSIRVVSHPYKACYVTWQVPRSGGGWLWLSTWVYYLDRRWSAQSRTMMTEIVLSDRGVRTNDAGLVEINGARADGTPRYSAQGIGCYAGRWIGADQLREIWSVERNFYARDMTDDGAWVIGNEVAGPVTTFLIHAGTRDRYALWSGIAYEPRVAWDGSRVWAVATGADGQLRRGVWTLEELRALKVGGTSGGDMPEVTILDWVKETTAPAVVGFGYRTTALVSVQQLIRPVAASEWLRVEIPLANTGGFSTFAIRDPGVYEIALEGRAADGSTVATGRVRRVVVTAPERPPVVTIAADEWARVQLVADDVIEAIRSSAALVSGHVLWPPEDHPTLAPRWLARYEEMRLRDGRDEAAAIAALTDEISVAVADMVRGGAR